jgi:hypothetical protein
VTRLLWQAVTGTVSSDMTCEQQYDNDDQSDADDTVAAVTEAVPVPAEAATEATEQENDEQDNEDGSERHRLVSFARSYLNIGPLRASDLEALLYRT